MKKKETKIMKTIEEYFNNDKEVTPDWLKNYDPNNRPSFDTIMNIGGNLYYPGSGYDGQPIKTFNRAHLTHKYFYVDYGINKEDIINELSKEDALKGYKQIDMIEFSEADLTPRGWKPHYRLTEEDIQIMKDFNIRPNNCYCLVFIFERLPEYQFEHGCERFALICIKGDGIATYDALFANRHKAPLVLVLQDHGFGGNYSSFGRGGALEQIAQKTKCLPEFILCADNTHIWVDYNKIPDVQHVGILHKRWLFERDGIGYWKRNVYGKPTEY